MYPTSTIGRLLATIGVSVALAACARQEASAADPSSPQATMTAYYEAGKRKDAAALKTLVSSSSLKALENPAVPVERVLLGMVEEMPDAMPKVRNERIDGDRATLEAWNADTQAWDDVILVREDGAWKIAFDEMDREESAER
jgi:hypothetical protein